MKARGVVFWSGIALLVLFGLAGWASGAFLRPGVIARDGKSRAPAIATDPSGTIYLVWVDRREDRENIYFNRSDDGGATWLPSDVKISPGKNVQWRAAEPQVATNGKGTVYVTWQSTLPNKERKEILFSASRDQGTTWQTQATPLKDLGHAFLPQIVADAKGRVAVAWYEEFKRAETHGLFIATSKDGGETWGDPRRLDVADPPGLLSGQRLATDGNGRLYVLWWETREKRPNVVTVTASEDFGRTWPDRPFPLSTGQKDAGDTTLAVDDSGHVYAAWAEWWPDSRPDIYVRTSSDRGKSWSPAGRLNRESKEAGQSSWPQIVAAGNGVVAVAWVERRPDAPGIYAALSQDHGQSWTPEQLVGPVPAGWRPRYVQLAADGTGRLATAWGAMNAKKKTEQRLYLASSTDRGKGWQAPVQIGPTSTDPVLLSEPVMAFDRKGTLLTVWGETRKPLHPALIIQRVLQSDLVLHRIPTSAPAGAPSLGPSPSKTQ